MSTTFEEFILEYIRSENPLHFKKINRNVRMMKEDPEFNVLAEKFYDRYDTYLERTGHTRTYAVQSYLRMINDFVNETIGFQETGKYSSSSFAEVNARVYSQPEVMNYYMHGLLLSQFIWKHHFALLKYFSSTLINYKNGGSKYLEVGAGHGLYLNVAIEKLGSLWDFSVVDVSETSLTMAREFTNGARVSFIHSDISEIKTSERPDFIVMGEVLEHVENPLMLLKQLHALLNDKGTLFITTPTNAPAIDHITLFRNRAEIRNLISNAGFIIVDEASFSSEELSLEESETRNISILFSAFLKKSHK